MKCPFCSHIDTKVINSRTVDDHSAIRRRRLCEHCNERFTTFERLETIPLAVIKRDGTREPFDRAKLLNGIVRSCIKRPISMDIIQEAVNEIENAINISLAGEIESQEIGSLVMQKLKSIDEVAYVRFASVYKHFKDIDTFMEEVSSLMDEKKNH